MKDENKGVYFDIDRKLYQRVKEYCIKKEIKIKDFIRVILEKGIRYEHSKKR